MALNSKLTHLLSLLLPALLLLGTFLPAVEATNRAKGVSKARVGGSKGAVKDSHGSSGKRPASALAPNAFQLGIGRTSPQFGVSITNSAGFHPRREFLDDGLERRQWTREVVRRAIMDALLEELDLD
ncbi:hypothetical protein DFP72DRAFT_900272 [Ephemerocybe angulata]|uniref:Uncharacterized protein n=1 Tax=Ephemerocybe angulata TaxID=980116 RepID=A0A8H6M3C1_9AGAR|nr:hypothetical protein DFP72DRAFT_900272 [Tulosesus angulatus]